MCLYLIRRIVLSFLKHTERPLPDGGKVLILNTGAIIGPEAEAMLQALHSRSLGGILNHLVTLARQGFKNFMKKFFVGYGHKSIGDCGTITIFIEGVSMLVAKAVQDSRLYAGQEASTRYIDFAKQPFIDPLGTVMSSALLESLRAFYLRGLRLLVPALKERHPRQASEKEDIYEKAINARAFDIMRGFLPAGASTNLAWHSNLRQVGDMLALLRHHPLKEVRVVAEAIESAMVERFPSSVPKRYPNTEEYNKWQMLGYYFNPEKHPEFALGHDGFDWMLLEEYKDLLASRPDKTELPKRIAICGTLRFDFLLDFASFRDIQRQRSVVQLMPYLSLRYGMHPWYLDELSPELHDEACEFLLHYEEALGELPVGSAELQYYIPMGYQVANRLSGDLPSLVYVAELRSGPTVHPTLRIRARQIGSTLLSLFGKRFGLKLYIDQSPDRFNIKRGTHDIVLK